MRWLNLSPELHERLCHVQGLFAKGAVTENPFAVKPPKQVRELCPMGDLNCEFASPGQKPTHDE